MRRTIIAGPIWTCVLFAISACGGQVLIGGAQPSDGSVEAEEQQLGPGSETDAANGASPATIAEGNAAPYGQATTVAADAYPIAPGVEATLCQVFPNPFGRDVDLVSIGITTESAVNALDAFLFSLPPSASVPRAPSALMGCLVDPLGIQPFFYFSNQPPSTMTYPQPNMGYPLSAANTLMLRVHYVNPSNSMGPAQTTLSLRTAIPGQVTTYVGAIFLRHTGFPVDSLDDGGPLTAQSSALPLDQDYSIFASWSFAQPPNAEVRASASGSVFYDSTHSPAFLPFSPLVEHSPPIQILGTSASIAWSCTYPTADLAQSGQCVYQGYYYPADPQAPDRIVVY